MAEKSARSTMDSRSPLLQFLWKHAPILCFSEKPRQLLVVYRLPAVVPSKQDQAFRGRVVHNVVPFSFFNSGKHVCLLSGKRSQIRTKRWFITRLFLLFPGYSPSPGIAFAV